MYYSNLKKELLDSNIIEKEDMYLLEGKLLFTNRDSFESAYQYFLCKNYKMITGKPRQYTHWSNNFTDYIYFEDLSD